MIKVTLLNQCIHKTETVKLTWLIDTGVKLVELGNDVYEIYHTDVAFLNQEGYDRFCRTNLAFRPISASTVEQQIDSLLPGERKQVMDLIQKLVETKVPESFMSDVQDYFMTQMKQEWYDKPADATHYYFFRNGIGWYKHEGENWYIYNKSVNTWITSYTMHKDGNIKKIPHD